MATKRKADGLQPVGDEQPKVAALEPEKKRQWSEDTGTVGVYEILKTHKLGSGAFGDVYLGRHRNTKQRVAVKIFKKNALKNGVSLDVLREVKLLVEFQEAGSHPNVISLFEFRQYEGNLATVMDYCFTDLRRVIADVDNDSLGDADIKCYTLQMLRGIEWLHKSWCLHRDLKPENLLISPSGHLKISDFGLAKQYATDRDVHREIVVTITYRSPELLFAELQPVPNHALSRKINMAPCIDMWSAGCILGEMMRRQVLFRATSDNAEQQLETIFQLCGTPSAENWPDREQVPGYVEFSAQPKSYLPSVFQACDRQLVNLLSELLQLSPSRRLSAKNALHHVVFKPEHKPATSEPEELETVRQHRRRTMHKANQR